MIKHALFILAVLTGCSQIPGTESNKIAKIEGRVRETLKDGESARFRDIHTSYDKKSMVDGEWSKSKVAQGVCGEVNSKNAYGAYVGFTPFFIDNSGKLSVLQDTSRVPWHPTAEYTARLAESVIVFNSCPPKPSA